MAYFSFRVWSKYWTTNLPPQVESAVRILLVYPVLMIVSWLPNIIVVFISYFNTGPSLAYYDAAIMTYCFGSLYGFFLGVLFFVKSNEARTRWKNLIMSGLRRGDPEGISVMLYPNDSAAHANDKNQVDVDFCEDDVISSLLILPTKQVSLSKSIATIKHSASSSYPATQGGGVSMSSSPVDRFDTGRIRNDTGDSDDLAFGSQSQSPPPKNSSLYGVGIEDVLSMRHSSDK